MSQSKTSNNMSFISACSVFFLFICIFFVGVGNIFNNKTLGMTLAIVSSSIIIGYNIYSYYGALTCEGSDCAGYGFMPFFTVPISFVSSIVLVVIMFLLKSVDN